MFERSNTRRFKARGYCGRQILNLESVNILIYDKNKPIHASRYATFCGANYIFQTFVIPYIHVFQVFINLATCHIFVFITHLGWSVKLSTPLVEEFYAETSNELLSYAHGERILRSNFH
jgi:hypothetical protein